MFIKEDSQTTTPRPGNSLSGVHDHGSFQRQQSSSLLDNLLKQTEQCHGPPAPIKQRHKSAPSPGSESGKKRVHFCDEESMSRIDEKAAKIRKINEPFKSAVYSNTTTIQQGVAHHQGVYTPSKPRELLGILKHPGGRSSFTEEIGRTAGSSAEQPGTSSSIIQASAVNTNRDNSPISAGHRQPDIVRSVSKASTSSSNSSAANSTPESCKT